MDSSSNEKQNPEKSLSPKEDIKFEEYPSTKSDQGLKSSSDKDNNPDLSGSNAGNKSIDKEEEKMPKESATFGEYPSTKISDDKNEKAVNKQELVSSGYNSVTGEYPSTGNKGDEKSPKESATFEEYPASNPSKVELKSSQSVESSTFGEYPATKNVSQINPSLISTTNIQPNLDSSSGYNSTFGEYPSTSNDKIQMQTSNSLEGATFGEYQAKPNIGIAPSNLPPLINPIPNAIPILNAGLPIMNSQTTVTVTTTTTSTTTTTTTNIDGFNQLQAGNVFQPIQNSQSMTTGTTTFGTYPTTTSVNGIQTSIIPSVDAQII